MRIFLMIASLAESGGAEMLVRNLALDYARAGHTVHVGYISDAASLGASRDYERAFQDQLDAAGISHAAIGHACRRNLLLGGWRLRRMVRRFRPDIVHMHLGYALLFQAVGLIRVPTVYTHHNIVFKFSPKLFRLFDRFVDRYVAICVACERLLEAHVGKPIALIYNGVPADFARGRRRDAPAHDLNVLSVGNLSAQKDYPTLVAVARRLVPALRGRGRAIRFLVAGEGSARAEIEAGIRAEGLEDAVVLLGARRDVPALMAEADLLIQCSRWEGLPITLIEAAMSGLPVVATDVGGSNEIVRDGVTGLLVRPGDPDGIAAAVERVVADQDAYRAMSAAAREQARRFTLASCAASHLALYAEVVAARRGAGTGRVSE